MCHILPGGIRYSRFRYSLPVFEHQDMTTAAHRLAGFAVALAVLFGLGALAGRALDPAPPKAAEASTRMTHADVAMKMSVRGWVLSRTVCAWSWTRRSSRAATRQRC